MFQPFVVPYTYPHCRVIGIVLNHDWAEPLDDTNDADIAAAQRANEFKMAWFADPIFFGDYPPVMRENVGERLPTFSANQKARLVGSWDVFFLNHYTSSYYSSAPLDPAEGWAGDQVIDEVYQCFSFALLLIVCI